MPTEMQEPFVSGVMPVHNAGPYLEPAVRSILDQGFARLELIAIDDGSLDGSLQRLEQLGKSDPRLRVLANPRNLGIVATRNRGFEECSASSRYIAIMDSDDISARHRIGTQGDYLEGHPACALVGSHNRIIDAQGQVIGTRRYPCSYAAICKVMTRYNPISQPVAMLRREVLAQVGPYDARYPRCQDYDLWCRIAARHEIANIDDFLLDYRLSQTQGKRTHLKETVRFTLEIQKRFMDHPRFDRPENRVAWLAQHAVLVLPEPVVLAAFKLVRYRR